MDLTGQQLGNYRLKSILGTGGYATVYLGTHVILPRDAAIKVLKEIALNEEDMAGFHDEARIISKLVHPNIIKVLEAGIEMKRTQGDGSIPYLVMDYAQQGSLRRRHPHGQVVPFKQIVSYVEQLASALDYAHNQKVLHLDVKPENVLVMSSGNIVLSDFGIAVTGHDSGQLLLQKGNLIEGTALYTAPERYSQRAKRACDQYSLAVVVYEWLVGTCPFTGSVPAIINQHISTPPPPLYGQYPHITKEIHDVVFRALAKDPDARYPSVLDFSKALIKALSEAPDDATIRTPTSSQLNPTVLVGPPQLGQDQPIVAPRPNPMAISPFQQNPAPANPMAIPQLIQNPAPANPMAIPQLIQNPAPAAPPPYPMAVPQMAQNPNVVAPPPQPVRQTPPPLAPIRPATDAMFLNPANTQQAGNPEDYTFRNPMPRPRGSRRQVVEDQEKPSAIFKALFFVPQFQSIGNWYGTHFYNDYARMPRGRIFRQAGILLNIISAFLLGVLIQPPSAAYIIVGLAWSIGFLLLCIRAVNQAFSGILGLLVAFYWAVVGFVIGTALSLHLNLFKSFLPPALLGILFLAASAYLHLRYVSKKNS